MQVLLPDISKFKIINGQQFQNQKRVCIFAFYSPIPGCFSSLERVLALHQTNNVYTLLISLDTEQKMKSYINEDSPRGSILKQINVAIDENNTMASFMSYNKFDALPAVYLFDEQKVMQWRGNPNDSALKSRVEYGV
ncbi:FixW_protein [Hexamita inflata]|uniref:Putative n=1 Tax=Hexamita inflata TaxID=28002 RepID=A0AA86PMM1_9EUKA|nr:FixW protein [Hexamita inflata]